MANSLDWQDIDTILAAARASCKREREWDAHFKPYPK